MVSFDVVSLFTSVPINEVKILIFDLLSEDRDLCKRTKLTVQDIVLCLELCFNFTIFSFKYTLYRQVFGAPMGSCISPVVANIFMAYVEKTAISIFQTPPTLWVRCIDDTFCVIKRSCVGEFHDHLDGISSFIKFTFELEVDGRLPFLDVFVTRQQSGALTTTIYHKPTHTNRYLQFTSHHPRYHKLSVARSLHSRLNTHITNHTDYCVQSSHFKQTLALNGYPRKYFCGQRKTTDRALPTRSFESFTSIPYIQGVSDKIQRVLNEVGVKVAMKPHLTIRKLLSSLKDPLDNSEKSCLVYQVPCRDCSFVYIGQTKRDLKLDGH